MIDLSKIDWNALLVALLTAIPVVLLFLLAFGLGKRNKDDANRAFLNKELDFTTADEKYTFRFLTKKVETWGFDGNYIRLTGILTIKKPEDVSFVAVSTGNVSQWQSTAGTGKAWIIDPDDVEPVVPAAIAPSTVYLTVEKLNII